ncbi:hypothetical protein EDB84DRAFT_1572994 [Lactarius hengduanensis]|nr:hypothetical protein EDB84DRAFT_1572994 [Lactarius hengduanensis]
MPSLQILPPPLGIRTGFCVTTLVHSIPHDNLALPPAHLSSSHNLSSLAGPALLCVDANPLDAPPPDSNDMSVPGSLHTTCQMSLESPRISAILLDPATARATPQGIGPSARTMLRPQHDADFQTSSDAPDFPSSPSPSAVLDTVISMGTLSSEHTASRSDCTQSWSDSHSLMPATASLATSSPLRQKPAHSSATGKEENSPKAALRGDKDKDTLDPSLLNPADTRAALHDPLRSITVVATGYRHSRRGLHGAR